MSTIKKTSEIVSSLSTATIPLISGGTPESILFSAGIQPLVQRGFESILNDIFSRNITKRECARLGASYRAAVSKVNENIAKGIPFRTDNLFIYNDLNYSKAEDILESVLKGSMNDTEEKKTVFYGYFIGNLAFCPEIDYSNAMSIQKIVNQLTYSHLCIIKYLKQQGTLNADNWKQVLNNTGDIRGLDIYHGFKEIVRFDLTDKVAPFQVGEEVGNIKLGALGEAMYKLMDLDKIDEADLVEIVELAKKMNK
nr:hypothetical protein [uncultured Bacteroides sp.]